MSSAREIVLIGGGTFLVVGLVAFLMMPGKPAEALPVAPVVSLQAPQSIVAAPVVSQVSALGAPPPDGVEITPDYQRQQLTNFLSERGGQPLQIIDATQINGSQRTQFCGTAQPRGGGSSRSWTITMWSHAPIEHTISNDESQCDTGTVLVRGGETVTADSANQERQAELDQYASENPIPTKSQSAGNMYEHIDHVSTYAVLIGRGAACGVDTTNQATRVGAWLDRVAPPGSSAQQTLLPMLMQQSRYHAQQQASGQSPDDCAKVARAIRSFQWP